MNKDKQRLIEMFQRVCGVKLLTEAFVDKDGNLKDFYKDLTEDDLLEIFKGYIECALWTEEENLRDQVTGDIDDEDIDDMDEIEKLIHLKGKYETKNFKSFVSDDIDINSRIKAYKDIKLFISLAGSEAINEAIEENGLFRLGMDIWFTRNGHGSGFFDHSYDNEKILTDSGNKLKGSDLYVGDDNKLYFS